MGGLLGLAFLLFGVTSLLAGLALLYRPEQASGSWDTSMHKTAPLIPKRVGTATLIP